MSSLVASPAGWKRDLADLLPLAIVSFALGMTVLLIVVHHAVPPLDLPALSIDARALDAVATSDRATADKLRATPPSKELRAIGSAFYAWNEAALAAMTGPATLATRSGHDGLRDDLRGAISTALQAYGAEATHDADAAKRALQGAMSELRALHTEMYLDAVHARSLSHAAPTEEQRRLEGLLGRVLERNGWIAEDGTQHVPTSVLRARYKLHWTSSVFGLSDCDGGSPIECYGYSTLPLDDEEIRALFAFLLAHPIVRGIDAVDAAVPARAFDRRRREYLGRLANLDSYLASQRKTKSPILRGYPIGAAYAVIAYHLGAYEPARDTFRAIATHDQTDGSPVKWWNQDARYFNWWYAAADRAP
jgi:hypothetical protein